MCSASHYWFQIPSPKFCCLLLSGPPANSTLLLHQSSCLPPFHPPLLLSLLPSFSLYHFLLLDSVAVTTTAKGKTTPNFSPSPHLIGQQPNLNASPPHFI